MFSLFIKELHWNSTQQQKVMYIRFYVCMFERQNENERKASNFKSAQKLDGRVAIIQS